MWRLFLDDRMCCMLLIGPWEDVVCFRSCKRLLANEKMVLRLLQLHVELDPSLEGKRALHQREAET